MNTLRLLQPLALAAISLLAACSSSPIATVPPTQGNAGAHVPGSGAPFLYVENGNSTLSAFSVAKSGALTAVSGSPYGSNTIGPSSFAIAVDPKGPYLYTTGTNSNNVAIFAIGAGGELTAVSDSTPGGDGAGPAVMTKSEKRLYVVDSSSSAITAFDVAKKGRLKTVTGSPYGITCPGFCDPDPGAAVTSGSYFYSIDTYGWYVSTFSISASGALTELNSYATHWGPNAAVMAPNGKYLYVTNGASADVSAYSVAGGVLTQLTNSPFAAGGTPDGITITPNGKFVYVANQGDGTISAYSAAGGALKQLKASPFADGSGTGPTAMAVDKSGEHLFVTNQSTSTIAVYTIGGSGAIAQISGSPFELTGALGPRGLALYEP
jgi:6-phosphogluconolactonase